MRHKLRFANRSVILMVLLVVGVSACSGEPERGPKEIAADFNEHQHAYDVLHALIIQDVDQAKSSGCMFIGFDRINDYWLQNGEWSRVGSDQTMTRDEVVEAVGLTVDRYGQYGEALAAAKASGVTRCPGAHSAETQTAIAVAATGISVSGCTTTAEIRSDFSLPDPQQTGSEITPLGDGWYLNHYCT